MCLCCGACCEARCVVVACGCPAAFLQHRLTRYTPSSLSKSVDITPIHNAALGWVGVGFLAASFMFMAVTQLPFPSQKKVLQYHSIAVLAQAYQSGRDTNAGLLEDNAPMPYWALAAVLFLISILPCYVGAPDKSGKKVE